MEISSRSKILNSSTTDEDYFGGLITPKLGVAILLHRRRRFSHLLFSCILEIYMKQDALQARGDAMRKKDW